MSACSLWSWSNSVESKRRSNWEPSEKPVFKTCGVWPALRFYWELLGALPSLPGDRLTSPSCIFLPSLTLYKVSSSVLNLHWMTTVELKNVTTKRVSTWVIELFKIHSWKGTSRSLEERCSFNSTSGTSSHLFHHPLKENILRGTPQPPRNSFWESITLSSLGFLL